VIWKTKRKTGTCKYPAECTGESGSGEKESNAIVLFVSLVPHAHIKHDSREEPAFCDAEEETDGKESRKILGDAHEGANDAPCEGEGGKPKPRCGEFEDDVSWDLGQDVTDKIDGQRGEVLVPGLFCTVVRDNRQPCAAGRDVLM